MRTRKATHITLDSNDMLIIDYGGRSIRVEATDLERSDNSGFDPAIAIDVLAGDVDPGVHLESTMLVFTKPVGDETLIQHN